MNNQIRKPLFTFLTIWTLVSLACNSIYKGMNPVDISEINSIRFMIQEIYKQKLDTIHLFSNTSESIDEIVNSRGELLMLTRKKISVGSEKSTKYYFKQSKLISSQHLEINTAKIKNKIFAESKQYYFNSEKTIFAESKTLKSNLSIDRVVRKLNLKEAKKFEASPSLLNDEKALIDKISTSYHLLN